MTDSEDSAIECREAAETMALLEAIMEGLTDSQNGALRDLCAAATREFLVWSAKHIPASNDPAKGSSAENMNAASLLRRLFERMAHPEPYQRSGPTRGPPLLLRVIHDVALYPCSDFVKMIWLA